MNQQLHDALVRMGEEDIQARLAILNAPPGATDEAAIALWDQRLRVDARNAVRFREMVATYGWPGYSLVGEDGAHVAWVLTQHCWMKDLSHWYLDLLEAAVEAGEAPRQQAVITRETVRVLDGEEPQLRPKVAWRNGVRVHLPLTDDERAAMDARRVALGLPTLDEWERLHPSSIGARHPSPLPPEEVQRRLQEYYDEYAAPGNSPAGTDS